MRNHIKTVVLLGALSALLVGIGALVAPGYLYLFGALALAMNLGAYFFSDRVVLSMHRAEEVSRAEAPGLHQMVEELAARAGIPKPRVYLLPDDQPNAFATGRNPEKGVVAVTQGLVHLLDERELRGVIAHELAHIKNRDILVSSIAAAAATAITYVANALSFGSLFGGGRSDEDGESSSPLTGLLVALVAPLAATLIQLGISRSREFMADETGARISGDPGALASARSGHGEPLHREPLRRGADPVAMVLDASEHRGARGAPPGAGRPAGIWRRCRPSPPRPPLVAPPRWMGP
jgi:heat shock protein HtpX